MLEHFLIIYSTYLIYNHDNQSYMVNKLVLETPRLQLVVVPPKEQVTELEKVS